jgi:hypothetical protein
MLSVTYKPFMLNVVMLNVAAPIETGDEKKFFFSIDTFIQFFQGWTSGQRSIAIIEPTT